MNILITTTDKEFKEQFDLVAFKVNPATYLIRQNNIDPQIAPGLFMKEDDLFRLIKVLTYEDIVKKEQ